MSSYISLLRPLQWSKNLFVFLPIFFAQAIGDIHRLVSCCVAFVAISLASSSIYILNDICDVEYDRNHPDKCSRPIAAGKVSIKAARIMYLCLLLSTIGIVLLFIPSPYMIATFALYLIINHAYSFSLKHIPLLDVMIVAFGFVLRIIIGAVAASVTPSHWIIIMTFLLALFLVMAKRRDDVIKFEKSPNSTRSNIQAYNRTFIDQSLTLIAGVTLVSYIMYTVDAEIIERFNCDYVYATSIFVLAGILRYMQLTLVDEKSWSPTYIISHDRFLQFCVIGWLAFFAYIIYG